MVIVELMGGLANQLFQYAHGRNLSIKLQQDLKFDLSFFNSYERSSAKKNTHIVYKLDNFNTECKLANTEDILRIKRRRIKPLQAGSILKKFGLSSFYNAENHFDNERIDKYDTEALLDYDDIYISGYYGDQKYFIDIEEIIRTEFTIKECLNEENKKMLLQINNSESVSLHVRRGDYISNNFFANIPLEYYHNAVGYMEDHFPNSTYFIFSDDLTWVEHNLKLPVKTIIVDVNDSNTDYMELMLMAECKNNIIANSTYSWWGAWLNNNSHKTIITPRFWFQNIPAQEKYEKGMLVPKNWIKL